MAQGPPRLDPYSRLLSRFFETLLLLDTLRKVQGPHLTVNHDVSSLASTRRRFVRNLAFLCDYKKGGDSTCAIAIEDLPEFYRFLIASNEGPSPSVVGFLQSLLDHVTAIIGRPAEQRNEALEELTRNCCEFADPRIKKEAKLLARAAEKCVSFLEPSDQESLKNWLQSFYIGGTQDRWRLCSLAYESRHDYHMRSIETLSREPDDGSNATEATGAFGVVRHSIGRLAAHQRAPRQLIEDGARLGELLASFSVGVVKPLISVPKPEADHKTSIDGILKRMLPANDPKHAILKQQLACIDRDNKIEQTILSRFQNPTFRPRTHAEVQIVEHFYVNDLKFAWDEKFIGCSKLACLCCKLYFQYHPLRLAPLGSHEKIYPNWSPPHLPQRAKDPSWKGFRAHLNRVITDLGSAALEQIARLTTSDMSHPDSLTGLTVSEGTPLESEDSDVSSLGYSPYYETEDVIPMTNGSNAAEDVAGGPGSESDTSDGGGVVLG